MIYEYEMKIYDYFKKPIALSTAIFFSKPFFSWSLQELPPVALQKPEKIGFLKK